MHARLGPGFHRAGMMRATKLPIVALLLLAGACANAGVRVLPQDSGVDARLRGISAVDGDVAWASGRNGTVLRTRDGGRSWQKIVVPGAGALDFRDIEAFDAETAVLLAIGPGEASRVYRTADGGETWELALQNHDPRGFFDCMAFDGQRGWLLGDPVDGRFQLFASEDSGRSWTPANGPAAVEGEAAFAASGTCIARSRTALAVVTGGAQARIHVRNDGDGHWSEVHNGLEAGAESKGGFSVAPLAGDFIVVGGDFLNEGVPAESLMFEYSHATGVSGSPWRPTPGYRSGVACMGAAGTCIAVGPTGVDAWSGTAWIPVSTTGYDAIDFAGNTGWASGDQGRIARIEVSD